MSWLVREGDVLASAQIVTSFKDKSKGLLGIDGFEGAMVFPRSRSVHTFGMRFAIDVAFCDKEMVVVGVTTMKRWRMGLPRRRGRLIIEAEAGAFERWGLRTGDQLELR